MKQNPYGLYIHLDQLTAFWTNNDSREENILKCGLISIESSTSLLLNIYKRTEPTADELCHKVLEGIEQQFALLNQYSFSTLPQKRSSSSSISKNIDYLKLLDLQYANRIDRITKQYFQLSQKLGMELGLAPQINEIRQHFNLKKNPSQGSATYLDYHLFTEQDKISNLNKEQYYNTEDALFMTVHQISECWFKIVVNELDYIQKILFASPPKEQKILSSFRFINEILAYLSEHIFLLEYMVLADYHPLRVALRGASGGQSFQAHEVFSKSKKLFTQFLSHLNKENTNILTVLERPKEFKVSMQLIRCFEQLERALKTFFFNHYLLSANVIGSQSFGSIGYELVSLADKFVAPVFPEIDQAKYDFTLKTNFLYGETSGILILEKEDFKPATKNNLKLSIVVIDNTIAAYFDAISALDAKTWIELFETDGYIEDPVGSRPYIGHKELAIFFKGILRTFSKFDMRILEKVYQNTGVKVSWEATSIAYNNKTIQFRGKEVFELNSNGKIIAAQVIWNPAIVGQQL